MKSRLIASLHILSYVFVGLFSVFGAGAYLWLLLSKDLWAKQGVLMGFLAILAFLSLILFGLLCLFIVLPYEDKARQADKVGVTQEILRIVLLLLGVFYGILGLFFEGDERSFLLSYGFGSATLEAFFALLGAFLLAWYRENESRYGRSDPLVKKAPETTVEATPVKVHKAKRKKKEIVKKDD